MGNRWHRLLDASTLLGFAGGAVVGSGMFGCCLWCVSGFAEDSAAVGSEDALQIGSGICLGWVLGGFVGAAFMALTESKPPKKPSRPLD
jgi:hypothetical protein